MICKHLIAAEYKADKVLSGEINDNFYGEISSLDFKEYKL